ncbi:4-hydroxy-3-methylbut-2-enyl diphosphate reductase [Magnetospira sp. QH-2]|uniref:4-hydroxy-3-methylbut-2-enyl diphosphate reductase n=1 Tax=Magnetospira sp. (strain QH-2) TaxID=1288970 RepID=UPI0003E81A7E|nr:4-hydroxy-3-methylbut-2-enyl diphosphate reductase [Magnetospira sp. QH-2]CCQ73413.1 4-hydroxy-3-methylbut-2-enyl diphosphate reductase 2 [Magnetospira sp. QH-2]
MSDAHTVQVILAQPRGFCAGVERAIEIVQRAIDKYGPPVYVRHEIVHNRRVVDCLKKRGAVFVDELDEIPEGAVTVFSAHGVAQSVVDEAASRDLPVLDATCPLVSKVHKEGRYHEAKGRQVVLIGHAGHPEVEGTAGQIPGGVLLVSKPEDVARLEVEDPEQLAYVTQTTLSVDDTRDVIEALKEHFPTIQGPDVKDICYATQNRQSAVRDLADRADLVLVVGSSNSSNSNRLRELASEHGVVAYLLDHPDELQKNWLEGVKRIGVTAGASAPEDLVNEIIGRLGEMVSTEVILMEGIQEDMHFKLPDQLRDAAE